MTLGITDKEFESAIDEASRTKRIDLAREKDFAIGPVEVVPSLRTLRGPLGEELLEPKVMQVLIALGGNEGTIFSRDDLIERCWEGRVVGESSINRVISLLRSALKAVCGETVTVENVPKVGYRLLLSSAWSAPLDRQEAEASPQASDDDAKLAAKEGSVPWTAIWLGAVAALLAAMVALTAFFASSQSDIQQTVTPLKVAMLPLKVGEGVDPLYARGLETELRVQLARVGRMEVTNSESARLLTEKGLSAEDICRKLGADFAWVGTLDIDADRVTLSARLIDSKTQETTFREALSSARDAAQNLPLRAARALATALGRPVSDRIADAQVNAADFQLYLTATGLLKQREVEGRRVARQLLEQVTDRNPEFADGLAGLAKAWFLYPSETKPEIAANRERAAQIAKAALELDPDALDALKIAGMVATTGEEQLAYLRRAVELDPGDAEAWYWLSMRQRDNILMAQDPLESRLRMIAVDPLWPPSWTSSDAAVGYGRLDMAREMEQDILSAAVTPSQTLLAQARLARLDGDLSGFLEFARRAGPTQTESERLYGTKLPTHMTLKILGLEDPDHSMPPLDGPAALIQDVKHNLLPSAADFIEGEAWGKQFWDYSDLVTLGLPLFIAEQREEELLAIYDDRFASPDEFEAVLKAKSQPERSLPYASAFLAHAFRNAGREAEAQAHIRTIEEQLELWRASGTQWVAPVHYELLLASLTADTARAVQLIERLREYGWPYSLWMQTEDMTLLLNEHPIFAPIIEEPEVQAVLEPIRTNLEKEREEAQAIGF